MKRPQRKASLSTAHYMRQATKAFMTNSQIEKNQIDSDMDIDKVTKKKLKIENGEQPKSKKTLMKNIMDFKNVYEYQYYMDKIESIRAVRAMINHLKLEDDEKRVKTNFKSIKVS